jgi:hypothetical protein
MVQSNESNLHVQNVWMHLPQHHCEDCSNPWPRRLHLVTRIALALAMRNTRWTFKSDSAMLSLRSVQDCSSKCRHGCDSSWVHMIPPVWICIVSKRLVQAKQAEMSQHEHQRCPNEAWCLHENWNATIYVYVYIYYSYIHFEVHRCTFQALRCSSVVWAVICFTSPENVTCLTRSAVIVLRAWPTAPNLRATLRHGCVPKWCIPMHTPQKASFNRDNNNN